MATAVNDAFANDSTITNRYHTINGGKWNHMMDQTHIGYTGWQQPDTQIMPVVKRINSDKTFIVDDKRVEYMKPPSYRVGEQLPIIPKGIPTVSDNEYIAIEAEHFSRKVDGVGVHWQVIPNLGRTWSSVVPLPQIAAPTMDNSVRLEYDFGLWEEADATLNLYLAPTLDTRGAGGLRLAVSIDDRPSQTLSFDLKPDTPEWNRAVSDNIVILKAPFKNLKAGKHTIKVFRIDGNVVLERLVLDTGGLKPSYLGPPESAAN
jgi:hypothetical protein